MEQRAPRYPQEETPSRLRLWLLLGLAVATLAGLVVLENSRRAPRSELIELADTLGVQWVDRPAPAFDLPLLQGGRLSTGRLHGHLSLVHFWASWCPTCRPELPLFVELQHRLGAQGLSVVHVSLDEQPDEAKKALPPGWTMDVAIDATGKTARAFGTEKLPEAYLIDAEGQVLLRFVANQPWLDPRMLRLLEGFLR